MTNGRAAVLGSSFTQCYAEEDGGGLMITDYATTSGSGDQIIAGAQLLSSAIAPDIVLGSSRFYNCSTGISGGCFSAFSPRNLTIVDTDFIFGSAGLIAGGLNVRRLSGFFEIVRSSFQSNTAANRVGAFYYEPNDDQVQWNFYSLGGKKRAVVRDTSFTGNVGLVDGLAVLSNRLAWYCQLGTYMPTTGAFTGDLGAPGCRKCAAGYYGTDHAHDDQACAEQCPVGHYCPEGTATPIGCPEGYRMPSRGASNLESCIPCAPGQYQQQIAAASCSNCVAGTYTSHIGASACEACPPGGYCSEEGATTAMVWQPCPAGTFSPESAQSSKTACLPCPAGTSSPAISATSNATCVPCREGAFASREGLGACELCPPGTTSEIGSTTCSACAPGTYTDHSGSGTCIPCPYPLSSPRGSVNCPTCLNILDDGYYLKNLAVEGAKMLAQPDQHCRPCPEHADCSASNTTISSLGVPRGYWRASPYTSELHRCILSDACVGSTAGSVVSDAQMYCADGYTGPRCESCVQAGRYFGEGRCRACPTLWRRVAIMTGVLAVVAAFLIGMHVAMSRVQACMDIKTWLTTAEATLHIQCKFKLLVTFYQITGALPSVYGVDMHKDFKFWMSWLDKLQLNLFDLSYPGHCIGDMRERLLVWALWPYVATLAAAFCLCINALVESTLYSEGNSERSHCSRVRTLLARCLSVGIFIFYLALPSVSRSIFKAKECESFGYMDEADDEPEMRISFLVADHSAHCDAGPTWSNQTQELDAYFWTFFVLWPVAVPLVFFTLILLVRRAIIKRRVTKMAQATSFLWHDYETSFLYWEVIDMCEWGLAHWACKPRVLDLDCF